MLDSVIQQGAPDRAQKASATNWGLAFFGLVYPLIETLVSAAKRPAEKAARHERTKSTQGLPASSIGPRSCACVRFAGYPRSAGGRVMGERCSNDLVAICALFYAMASLVGCTAVPTLLTPTRELSSVAVWESIPQIPIPSSSSSSRTIVIGPGESVRIRFSHRGKSDYLCSTGRPLECHSLGTDSYCFCGLH